jgi:diguanylate cyclase (GGDEF)-like protein
MISLKKYLDAADAGSALECPSEEEALLAVALSAYCSALLGMGIYSLDVCPGLGKEFQQILAKLGNGVSTDMSAQAMAATEKSVREQIRDWGGRAAKHYREKAGEVKDILLIMARTAESVGARDQRCAKQVSEVTTRLKTIANLEDLTQIRASIEKSAGELKTSIDRMTAEGKAVIDQLQVKVSEFQVKLEEAEHVASCDSLTGLRSRHSVECQIETRMNAALPFCVAMIDIDGFKKVNDDHGHMVGDELLRLFSAELKSRCRTKNVVGRWGGDEFIILLDCSMAEAKKQTDRLIEWTCGSYSIHGVSGPLKIKVDASIGLAEYFGGEQMTCLLSRADAAMYKHKAASSANGTRASR